jgi:hypothetical protein
LKNYLDKQYYGSLYIGSQRQEIEFIFDTGSPWIWTPTIDMECSLDNCPRLFDYNASETYRELSGLRTHLEYGSGGVRGYYMFD